MELIDIVCCRCKRIFDNLRQFEEHAYGEYLEANKGRLEVDWCGNKFWTCFGCERQFASYQRFCNHLRLARGLPLHIRWKNLIVYEFRNLLERFGTGRMPQ